MRNSDHRRRFPGSLFPAAGLMAMALMVSVLMVSAAVAQEPSQRQGPATYNDRPIAHVMSYLGAPWLERDGREAEEDTSSLLAKMALRPGQIVADIGCGSGYYTRRMARQVAPGGHVFAVDIQPQMLEILRTNVEREGLDNVIPVLGQPDNPVLPDAEVDWILLVDVYHEFEDPEAMLARMREALSPGGRIALAEYRLKGPSAAHIKLDHRMSVAQVLAEWEPAGFRLVELWEELPTQHLFIFAKR